MQIQLNDSDLEKMPQNLRSSLLGWLEHKNFRSSHDVGKKAVDGLQKKLHQLALAVETPKLIAQRYENSQIRLTQLFDVGITHSGMPLRVKLTKKLGQQLGYRYVTSGLAISQKGTVVYKGNDFDKPSPLVKEVIGSTVNGWEYLEVQRQGNWVCLDELRKTWRSML